MSVPRCNPTNQLIEPIDPDTDVHDLLYHHGWSEFISEIVDWERLEALIWRRIEGNIKPYIPTGLHHIVKFKEKHAHHAQDSCDSAAPVRSA